MGGNKQISQACIYNNIMFKAGIILCLLLGVCFGGTPHCSTVWEDQCWDVPQQHCSSVQKPYTNTYYEQECTSVQVPKEECETEYEEECNTEHREVCETVYRDECWTEQINDCTYKDERVCDES